MDTNGASPLKSCMRVIAYCCLAGTLTCPLAVQNVGTVPFADVAVNGNNNNCSAVVLSPGQTIQCNMWGDVNASTTTYGLAATSVNGTAWSSAAQPKVPAARIVVANPAAANATAVLVVSVSSNVSVVSRPGEAVLITFTLVSCFFVYATMHSVVLASGCGPQLHTHHAIEGVCFCRRCDMLSRCNQASLCFMHSLHAFGTCHVITNVQATRSL